METHFPADFFKGNRSRLQKLFTGTAPIVLISNGLLQRSTDSPYPFQQDGSFWYLTGIDDPNVILVIDKGKEYLIIPELSEVRQAFDGQQDSNLMAATSGITEVLSEKEGWKKLSARVKRAGSVAVLSPNASFIESLGMYTNPSRRRLIRELKKHNNALVLQDLSTHLQRLRMVKQSLEIEAIKRAVSITSKGLQKVRKKYESGKYKNEFEIELELTGSFYKNGGSGHSFEPIVAAGDKACVIHAHHNHSPIDAKQSLLLDVGATYDHYAADITRSWAIAPSKRYEAVHNAVNEVAAYARAALKPGVMMREYEVQVHQFMGEKLRTLGLIKNIERDDVRHYFPHATSHFLGIDVHDVGDYDVPLEPGVVLTVEPGIYIPEEGIGIRIEDDLLITAKGNINLSASLSSDL